MRGDIEQLELVVTRGQVGDRENGVGAERAALVAVNGQGVTIRVGRPAGGDARGLDGSRVGLGRASTAGENEAEQPDSRNMLAAHGILRHDERVFSERG